jgi:capsular polysaccharide biosynthesis protein
MRMMHPPVDLLNLVAESVIEDRLRREPASALELRTPLNHVAHAIRVGDVLYIPEYRLQILGDRRVPIEAMGNRYTSAAQPAAVKYYLADVRPTPYSSPFETTYVDDEVYVLSNVYSSNLYHFSEELLRVVLLERAGMMPRYVLPNCPLSFAYIDALGLDRQRVIVPSVPTIFRSVLYVTNISLADLSLFSDLFLELRERVLAAASGIPSPYGKRLWLERGAFAVNRARELVPSADIDRCLDEYGFTRLDMGALPLLEQIAAVHQAEVIAGPHGAALTHCMYMKTGSTVIELFSPNYLYHCWLEICRLLKHRYLMLAGTNTRLLPYAHSNKVHVEAAQLRMAFQATAMTVGVG